MRPNEELLHRIGQVRSKWKAFVWMRGLLWVLGLLVVAIALGIYMAAVPSVPFWAVRTLSIGSILALLAMVVWKLVLPLRRVPTDVQLARFVEEKNPGLEESLTSAVEAIHKPKPEHGLFSHLLIKDALDRTRNVHFGEQINKRKFRAFAAANGALVLAFFAGLYLASMFLPNALDKLIATV